MIAWESLISALLTLVVFLLGLIIRRLGGLEEKLDKKQSKEDCQHQMLLCHDNRMQYRQDVAQRIERQEEIWEALSRHSHTGLAPDSKVTR